MQYRQSSTTITPHFIPQLAQHFAMPTTEDGEVAFFNDAFIPLLGALVGSEPAKALSDTMNILGRLPKNAPTLLQKRLKDALEIFGQLDRNIVVSSTFDNKELRNFSQSLQEEGSFRIDIWLPSSAACAYVTLQMAHLHIFLTGQEKSHLIQERLQHYSDLLKMLATAVADGGTIAFESYPIEPSLPVARQRALDSLNAAIGFILFHELGHILHGHIEKRQAGKLSPDTLRRQEFEADEFALRCLLLQEKHNQNVIIEGILSVMMAVSLMTEESDDRTSPTHPSLVSRHKRLCDIYEQIFDTPQGYHNQRLNTLIANTFGNVFDRDRCPAWLGVDRRAALGLPPDHQFNFKPLDFKSMGRHSAVDVRRPRPKTRKISLL